MPRRQSPDQYNTGFDLDMGMGSCQQAKFVLVALSSLSST